MREMRQAQREYLSRCIRERTAEGLRKDVLVIQRFDTRLLHCYNALLNIPDPTL